VPPLGATAGNFKFLPFVGGAISTGAGFAVGAATAPTLRPILQDLENVTWEAHPSRPVPAGLLASGVAQGQIPSGWAYDEAKRTGINGDRFSNLIAAANTGPGVPAAFDLWRRGVIDADGFRRAVRRQGLEGEWIEDLVKLKDELLDPGQLAAAIHRGLVPDPGLLKGEQPSGPFTVEAYPVFPIQTLDEAAGSGYDKDRLGVLVGLQGLPMGPHEAALALFRGIITHGDYIRAFNTSNSRNEWAAAVLEQSRQIPTARDFFENALRGYHDFDWALGQAKRHGMSEADATVIYQNQGRPMNIRQITQALSRGGVFHPELGEIKDPYDAAIVEGNVKPAYYDLAKSLKYTLPSPFVMRQLTASGVWSEAKAAKRLKDSGWIPQDADEAAKAWAGGGGATTDPHVTKAHNSLWTTMVQSYTAAESDAAALAPGFNILGVPAAARTEIIATLDVRRDLIRKQLTPAQIKKAYQKATPNEATGQPWTYDDALAAMLSRGWSHADATTFLKT
jgi:hypothetical protein